MISQPEASNCMIHVEHLHKHFKLHNQGGTRLQVLEDISLQVNKGNCLVLDGPSGKGKSTLLRCLYGNYLAQGGQVKVNLSRQDGITEWLDLAKASPREILYARRHHIGYVSQFLRVIPRVPVIDIVSEPLRSLGVEREEARQRAATLLERLNLPERLWQLSPSTFSGGEQQRINIAHCFIVGYPILLLDEPTASLDTKNRAVVMELIEEAMEQGTAIVGIFHDSEVRNQVATDYFRFGNNTHDRT